MEVPGGYDKRIWKQPACERQLISEIFNAGDFEDF